MTLQMSSPTQCGTGFQRQSVDKNNQRRRRDMFNFEQIIAETRSLNTGRYSGTGHEKTFAGFHTMTEYDHHFKDVHVMFENYDFKMTLRSDCEI
jgi:hypothetical protein